MEIERKRTVAVNVGGIQVGGGAPIVVQSMTNTDTEDAASTADQVAALALALEAVMRAAGALPVGVNVLRNDARSGLGLCATTRASFLRINVHTGAAVGDQGLLEGRAAQTLRARSRLCPGVHLLCDVHVKHSTPLGRETALTREYYRLLNRYVRYVQPNLRDWPPEPGAKYHKRDGSKELDVRQNATITAALVTNALGDAEMWRANVLATRNLVAAATRRRIRRFVHLEIKAAVGQVETLVADGKSEMACPRNASASPVQL